MSKEPTATCRENVFCTTNGYGLRCAAEVVGTESTAARTREQVMYLKDNTRERADEWD